MMKHETICQYLIKQHYVCDIKCHWTNTKKLLTLNFRMNMMEMTSGGKRHVSFESCFPAL